jgi:REP element-mobilizing transposase RayT
LKGYDYGQTGSYFVTVCAYNRECLFGNIVDGNMVLNEYGMIVRDEWEKSSNIRLEIKLDSFIVMPNHFHGIVFIAGANNAVGANGRSPLHRTGMGSKTLSSFVAGYKSAVTKRINELRQNPGIPVWQRNYYEHIIRGEDELNRIREYIVNNPVQWDNDRNNPGNQGRIARSVAEILET